MSKRQTTTDRPTDEQHKVVPVAEEANESRKKEKRHRHGITLFEGIILGPHKMPRKKNNTQMPPHQISKSCHDQCGLLLLYIKENVCNVHSIIIVRLPEV